MKSHHPEPINRICFPPLHQFIEERYALISNSILTETHLAIELCIDELTNQAETTDEMDVNKENRVFWTIIEAEKLSQWIFTGDA